MASRTYNVLVRAALAFAVCLVVTPLAAQTRSPILAFPPAPKHLVVTTGASGATVKPGGTLLLMVDIVPNPGIHVYAPGAKGYLPIAFTLGPQKGATLAKTVYPKSEMLLFAPLNERVPVYQKPFRLTREVTIAGSVTPGATLTLAGTIDYQACDDKICFVPASAPVAWTVGIQ